MNQVQSDPSCSSRIKLRLENQILPPDLIVDHEYNVNLWRNTRLEVTINDLCLEVQPQTMKCVTEFLEDQKPDFVDNPITFEVTIYFSLFNF